MYFVDLPEIDLIYKKFRASWKSAVQRSIKIDKPITKPIGNALVVRAHRRSNSCDRSSTPNRALDISSTRLQSFQYTDVSLDSNTDILEPMYCNPALETLIQEKCSLFRKHTKSAKTRDGILDVSHRSLHFTSFECDYVVTLPFVDISQITLRSNVIELELAEKDSFNICISLTQKDVAVLILQLHKTFDGENSCSSFLSDSPFDAAWGSRQTFFNSYMPQNYKSILKEWKNYLSYFGRGSTMIRTHTLEDLIFTGIPNSLRR